MGYHVNDLGMEKLVILKICSRNIDTRGTTRLLPLKHIILVRNVSKHGIGSVIIIPPGFYRNSLLKAASNDIVHLFVLQKYI